jgi:hypothetical protein
MCVFMPKVERANAWFYAYHDVSLKDDLIECEDCIMAQWDLGIWNQSKVCFRMNGMQLVRDFVLGVGS